MEGDPLAPHSGLYLDRDKFVIVANFARVFFDC